MSFFNNKRKYIRQNRHHDKRSNNTKIQVCLRDRSISKSHIIVTKCFLNELSS